MDKPKTDIKLPPLMKDKSSKKVKPQSTMKKMCRKFSTAPEAEPLTISFSVYPNTLDHCKVLQMVKDRLRTLPDVDRGVRSIRCELRNVICASHGLPDRWIIRVTSQLAMRELQRGLHDKDTGQNYVIRDHTSVMQAEYKMYLKTQKVAAQMRRMAGSNADIVNTLCADEMTSVD